MSHGRGHSAARGTKVWVQGSVHSQADLGSHPQFNSTHMLRTYVSFQDPVSGAGGCIVNEQQEWTITWNWGRHAGTWLQYHIEIKKRDAG